MASLIPHSSIINAQLSEYLSDCIDSVGDARDQLPLMPEFRGIYKNSLGTFTALARLAGGKKHPLLNNSLSIVKRGPLLITTMQVQMAYVDLRRLIESISAFVYFREHPVEWSEYQHNPNRGFVASTETPIKWAANRQTAWHFDYIRERYSFEGSGIVSAAVDDFNAVYRHCSSYVHAKTSKSSSKISDVFDECSKEELRSFSKFQKQAYTSTLLLVLAMDKTKLGKFTAIERAWFDWVIGAKTAQNIRAGKFLDS